VKVSAGLALLGVFVLSSDVLVVYLLLLKIYLLRNHALVRDFYVIRRLLFVFGSLIA